MVWGFEMTGVGYAQRIAGANFSVEQTGVGGGSYSYDIEAHVIRTSSSSAIVASDYETSASLLMTNFVESTTGTRTLDAAGTMALTSYLQDNWKKGEYAFIGLKARDNTDGDLTIDSFPNGSNDFYSFGAAAKLILLLHPPLGTWFSVR